MKKALFIFLLAFSNIALADSLQLYINQLSSNLPSKTSFSDRVSQASNNPSQLKALLINKLKEAQLRLKLSHPRDCISLMDDLSDFVVGSIPNTEEILAIDQIAIEARKELAEEISTKLSNR